MSTCFILGAGFSKAVADLPLMKDFADRFREIRDQEKALGHKNRSAWGDEILRFIDELEDEFFRTPCVGEDATYDHCTLRSNFESLISYIDLNLSGDIRATVTRRGVPSDFTKSALFSNQPNRLREVRKCIETYIYLTFIGPWRESPLLGSFLAHLQESDRIVTFNYDLLLESALYRQELWTPADGYGFELQGIPDLPRPADRRSSWVIHKVHGSLNWKGIHPLFRPRLELSWCYDDGTPVFPGYLSKTSLGRSVPYEGAHTLCWMMPSFVKQFAAPEQLDVWRRAMSSVRCADEVVIIGYRLPKEDAAACLLLGAGDLKVKRVTIVNPDAEHVLARLRELTVIDDVQTFSDLNGYLCLSAGR